MYKLIKNRNSLVKYNTYYRHTITMGNIKQDGNKITFRIKTVVRKMYIFGHKQTSRQHLSAKIKYFITYNDFKVVW